MSFSTPEVAFLHRLMAERPASRLAGPTASHFCENYSIGLAAGRSILYQEVHFQAIERLLAAHKLPPAPLKAGASRADAAQYGGMSEKSMSVAPGAGSIAVKACGPCVLAGRLLETPPGAYMVLTPEVAERVTCQRLMVVENLETFRMLEAYRWIDYRGLTVLAVYRGDLIHGVKEASNLIKARSEPVWGFFDFDPAGLVMANSLPAGRLEQLVLPDQDWLRAAAREGTHGLELFASQLPVYGSVLAGADQPSVANAWRLMRELKSGVAQERMAGAAPRSPPLTA